MASLVDLVPGIHIIVHWTDDDAWYKGRVSSSRPEGGASSSPSSDEEEGESTATHRRQRVWIKYDDGDEAWMNPVDSQWEASQNLEQIEEILAKKREQKRRKVFMLKVGSVISVWWPNEGRYFAGKLIKIRQEEEKSSSQQKRRLDEEQQSHLIRYEDGDEEWTDLEHRKFYWTKKMVDALQVGDRISISQNIAEKGERRYEIATVIAIDLERESYPHKVRYDNHRVTSKRSGKQKRTMRLNLYNRSFMKIDTRIAAAPSHSNSTVLRKRKRGQIQQPSSQGIMSSDRYRNKKKIKLEFVEKDEEKYPLLDEKCGVCLEKVTTQAKATSCYHIFCAPCMNQHFHMDRQVNDQLTCPRCRREINADLTSYDPDEVSFKAVEALNRATGEIDEKFSSASAASLARDKCVPARILEACQSKRRDDREYRGYYWRFEGSKDRILKIGEATRDGIAVEQVCLDSGKVIEVFPSSRQAYEKTGINRCTIRRVLEKRGKANGGGFFWRFEGETHCPWPDPTPTSARPVEQLDFDTGCFLNSFASLANAKKAVGGNHSCIANVCNGNGRGSARGYFWRWKGSTVLPNHLLGMEKIIEIRKEKDGPVFKELKTAKEAQAFLGHQCTWSQICRHCRQEDFHMGYFWKYRNLHEPVSSDEKVVGKRLRISQQQEGTAHSQWLEATINSFHTETGKHEILYDDGRRELRKLSEISYEWKNDQGQRPVEQLNLDGSKVIATFNSIAEAAESLPQMGERHVVSKLISGVLRGNSMSCRGYFWRYKGSIVKPRKQKAKKKVEQLCLKTKRVLTTHPSIAAAGRAVGITYTGISYCCNGRNYSTSAGGFGWRFAAQEDD